MARMPRASHAASSSPLSSAAVPSSTRSRSSSRIAFIFTRSWKRSSGSGAKGEIPRNLPRAASCPRGRLSTVSSSLKSCATFTTVAGGSSLPLRTASSSPSSCSKEDDEDDAEAAAPGAGSLLLPPLLAEALPAAAAGAGAAAASAAAAKLASARRATRSCSTSCRMPCSSSLALSDLRYASCRYSAFCRPGRGVEGVEGGQGGSTGSSG